MFQRLRHYLSHRWNHTAMHAMATSMHGKAYADALTQALPQLRSKAFTYGLENELAGIVVEAMETGKKAGQTPDQVIERIHEVMRFRAKAGVGASASVRARD